MDFKGIKQETVDSGGCDLTSSTRSVNNLFDKNFSKITKKCGEVFIDNDDFFSFLCTLCEAPFEEVNKFLFHVKCTHKKISSSKSIIGKQENNLEVNDNDSDDIKCEPINLISTVVDVDTESKLTQSTQQTDNSTSTADISIPKQTTVRTRRKIYNFRVGESDEVCSIESDLHSNTSYSCSDESDKELVKPKSSGNKRKHSKNESEEEYKKQITKDDLLDDKNLEDNLQCQICEKKFVTKKSLFRHKKTVNCNKKSPEPRKFICDICGKRFKYKRNLEDHKYLSRRGHKLELSEKILKDLSQSTVKKIKELQSGGSSSSKCSYCGKFFFDSGHRAEHERIHTGEKPFQCQICGKQFRTRGLTLSHEKHHTTERLFKCEVCNLTFKTKGLLSSHMQRHGEKKIQCSYCDKLFFQMSEKREHERFHTGEKRHKCEFCGKYFFTSGSLTAHKRSHLGIRPFQCQHCGASFCRNSYLLNHIVIHSSERPYACTICNATFKRKKNLGNHERIHSEFRKHICNTCGKGFKEQKGLNFHMRIHNETVTESPG